MRRRRTPPLPAGPFAVAAAGFVLVAAGLLLSPAATIGGWLAADLMLLGLSLGALLVLMIHALTGGRWGDELRPVLLAMAAALPLPLAGLLLPLAGHAAIFAWTGAPPAHAAGKLGYLAPTFLAARTVVIAAIWLAVLWTGEAAARRGASSARAWSVAGLVAYAVTMTFFATDWMVALDARFYSTIYPMLEASGELAGAFAAAVLGLYVLGVLDRREEAAEDVLINEDLANLLFGFVLLWVYLAFMQWLVIWAGDLPEEIGWYRARGSGAWPVLLLLVVALHAVLPVAGFLSRRMKRSPCGLALLAGSVLVGHLLDVAWRIAPAFAATLPVTAAMLGGLTGLGGLWLAAVARLATAPRLQAAEGGAHG